MMKSDLFTTEDMAQIMDMGLSRRDMERQLALYGQGPAYLNLNRSCAIGDGIISPSPARRKKLIEQFDEEALNHRLLKFVPASGAASRMFERWFAAAGQGDCAEVADGDYLLRTLKKMPFMDLIRNDQTAARYLRQKNSAALFNYLLSEEGLQYGWLPKALIQFHAYPGREFRTALEEHLVEAASFIRDAKGNCCLHFTLSPEHIAQVKEKLSAVHGKYERMFQVKLAVEYSVQSPSTNILAVDENHQPCRDEQGRLVFRPGGHGSLLQNLAALDADFIFVKNIDNVVPQNILKRILPYKKMLGGLAFQIQGDIFAMLSDLEGSVPSTQKMKIYEDYCRETLNSVFPEEFHQLSLAAKQKKLLAVLNRPLRICAVVKNVGEPGGGPFWVREKDATETVQIVEAAHVHPNDKDQQSIWRHSGYFNPVDMVCCIRNYRGEKFDLRQYVDYGAYLISAKTQKGQAMLAQELPGLWNGGMAYWNTVFVELPLEVFNPVKTVDDLLRPQHTAGKRMRKS